jgi:hypothetical protein
MRTIPISQMPLRTTLATSILLPMPPKKVQLTTLLLQLRLQRSIQHCSYPLHYTSDHLRRESGCSDRRVHCLSPHHHPPCARRGQDFL